MCEPKKQFQETYLVLVNLTNSIVENCSETQKKGNRFSFFGNKNFISYSMKCGVW